MDMQQELEAALAEREAIKAELGDAIIAGTATSTLKSKLAKAEAAVEAAEIAQEAIVAAQARAAERDAEQAEAKRQADIEARWQQAEVDHADIMATANAIQRNWEKQKELLLRMRHQSRAFANNYRDLGCNVKQMSVLRGQNWLPQLLVLLRESIPDMRWRMQNVKIEGALPSRDITSHIPPFERIFPQRAKKEAA